MFSATFSDDVRELAATFLNDATQVQIARRNAPVEAVRQIVHPVDRHRKRELLSYLIRSGRIDRALVFTRTKHAASRLAEQLVRDGIDATAIHGDRTQGQRVRALDDFKEGTASILVATEVAARGLDIDGLPHVVNYELPTTPEDYVHRIGRTGRAGLQGDAVSLVCIDEAGLLDDIEALLRKPIPWEYIPGFEPDRTIAAQPLREVRGRGGAPRTGRTFSGPRGGRSASSGQTAPRRGARPSTTHGSQHAKPRPATHSANPAREGSPRSMATMPGERIARAG
jgi:ATP-dependent RNA helicase RhlE